MPKITDSLITLVYPQACHSCENSVENLADGVACAACWEKTRVFSGGETLCHRCGAFLSEKPTGVQTFCHACDEHFYDRAVAAGLYEHALAVSVLHLKREPFVAQRLRRILFSRFRNAGFGTPTLIVPVPLFRQRRLERGFNQAAILAAILAEKTGIKLDKQSLIRQKQTLIHRAGMDRKGRELSVKNAFDVKRQKLIEGENILLIDDVFTSGATASNCAKALKKCGAAKVSVLTLARAK